MELTKKKKKKKKQATPRSTQNCSTTDLNAGDTTKAIKTVLFKTELPLVPSNNEENIGSIKRWHGEFNGQVTFKRKLNTVPSCGEWVWHFCEAEIVALFILRCLI